MNKIILFILIIALGLVGYGFYLIETPAFDQGHKFIGIGVALIALVVMPLFIWLRYKDKSMEQFTFKDDLLDQMKKANEDFDKQIRRRKLAREEEE